MEQVVVIHDESDLDAFRGVCPLTFDESVFDRIFDGAEN
jgi:hypothetical protein